MSVHGREAVQPVDEEPLPCGGQAAPFGLFGAEVSSVVAGSVAVAVGRKVGSGAGWAVGWAIGWVVAWAVGWAELGCVVVDVDHDGDVEAAVRVEVPVGPGPAVAVVVATARAGPEVGVAEDGLPAGRRVAAGRWPPAASARERESPVLPSRAGSSFADPSGRASGRRSASMTRSSDCGNAPRIGAGAVRARPWAAVVTSGETNAESSSDHTTAATGEAAASTAEVARPTRASRR